MNYRYITNNISDTVKKNMEMPDITFINLVNWVAASAMIFGGVVPFIPQYLDIRKSRNADGFSLFVCLTLLIANILRIMFWFGKHFELPLLAQSFIMVVTMMALVELCVRVKKENEIVSAKQRRFLDFELSNFWKWSDFLSYVEFMSTFTLLVGVMTYIFLKNTVYVELIGFLAVFAEAMLGSPQFYRNHQNKSTAGMSIQMVGFWTCGDVFKTVYFILRNSPPQFWICGMLQVSIDIAILLQVYCYSNTQVVHKPAQS